MDPFWLEVSDGLGSDSVLVYPIISWEKVFLVGEIDFNQERQSFFRKCLFIGKFG